MNASARQPEHHTGAFLILLLGGSCIGFAPVLVRLSDTGPVASAFWRLALAAPLLWLLAHWRARNAPSAPRSSAHWRNAALLSGLFFALDLGVWHFSISLTTVANATLLANCAPLFVTLYAWLMHRQRPGVIFALGLMLALGGAVLLVGPHFSLGGARMRGDLLGIVAALFYTAYMLAVREARTHAGTLHLMALSTTISALVLLPVAVALSVWQGQPFWPTASQGWWVVLALALVTQVGGQCCIAYALAHLPVTLSTTGLLVQPVVAAVAAWLLFGEMLAAWQLIGAAVLLTGIYIAKRGSG